MGLVDDVDAVDSGVLPLLEPVGDLLRRTHDAVFAAAVEGNVAEGGVAAADRGRGWLSRCPWLPSVSRSPSGVSSGQAAEVDAEPAAHVGERAPRGPGFSSSSSALRAASASVPPTTKCMPWRNFTSSGVAARGTAVRGRPRCTSRPRPVFGANVKVASALAAQNCWPRPELPAWKSNGVRCGEGADRCGPSIEYRARGGRSCAPCRGRRGCRSPGPGAGRPPPRSLPRACRPPRRIRPPRRSARHAWSARWR